MSYSNHETNEHEYNLYVKELTSIPLLSLSEEKAIGHRIQQRDAEAIALLVQSNLRFVIKIAKEYSGRGVPFLDLINEGNVALIHAAYRFDPSRNVRFISYAVWWIRESLGHAVANFSGVVRFPIGIYRRLRKIEAILQKKTVEMGRIPTLDEVANETNIGVRKLSSLLKLREHLYMNRIHSESNLRDVCNLLKATGLEADPLSRVLHAQIHKVLQDLTHQEEKVLKLRYGIEDEMTLQQIGNLLGLSRERIRQIEMSGLKKCKQKLSSFSYKKELRNYEHSSTKK
jgi:RNA polymerase primary sigma factor